MPVPQTGTATSVVSTGTREVVRSGIEGQSVLAGPGIVKPRLRELRLPWYADDADPCPTC